MNTLDFLKEIINQLGSLGILLAFIITWLLNGIQQDKLQKKVKEYNSENIQHESLEAHKKELSIYFYKEKIKLYTEAIEFIIKIATDINPGTEEIYSTNKNTEQMQNQVLKSQENVRKLLEISYKISIYGSEDVYNKFIDMSDILTDKIMLGTKVLPSQITKELRIILPHIADDLGYSKGILDFEALQKLNAKIPS
jgi:hypothetical protein